MVKKGGADKLLVLLVIFVALGLIVDLLSLNAIYSLQKSQMSGSLASLKGELASSGYFGYPSYDYCGKRKVCANSRLYEITEYCDVNGNVISESREQIASCLKGCNQEGTACA